MKIKLSFVLTFVISLLFCQHFLAQEYGLQIDKQNSRRAKVYKESKRIKVYTSDGKRYKGKWTIEDEKTILINGELLSIDDIYLVKDKSFFTTATRFIVLAYGIAQLESALFVAEGIGIGISAMLGIGSTFTGLLILDVFDKKPVSKKSILKIVPL